MFMIIVMIGIKLQPNQKNEIFLILSHAYMLILLRIFLKKVLIFNSKPLQFKIFIRFNKLFQ